MGVHASDSADTLVTALARRLDCVIDIDVHPFKVPGFFGATIRTAAVPVSKMLYFVGTVGWVVSFGAVAAAHRARQLSALWRAIRENRLLRGLLRDLEALSPPALTYPRTGWTPLLMRPHSALLRTRIECRDRLLTLSPHLGEGLDTAERQHPDMVAAALSQLRQRHDSVDLSRPTRPLALLTADTLGTDPLVELARSYTQLAQN